MVTLCLECCNHSNLPAFTCGMHTVLGKALCTACSPVVDAAAAAGNVIGRAARGTGDTGGALAAVLQLPRQQVCPKALHLYHLTGVCGETKQDRRTSAFSLLSPSFFCASWWFMLHFSTGYEPRFQKQESSILRITALDLLHAVQGPFPGSQTPSPFAPLLSLHIPVHVSRG